jgi:signal transduction histidine kinase
MTVDTAPGSAARAVPVYRLPLTEGTPHAKPAKNAADDWMLPLLRRNAVWFCQLRWGVVLVLAGIGLLALIPGPRGQAWLDLQPRWALGAAGVVAGLNGLFHRFVRQAGERAARRSVERLLWTQIIADLLVLTAVIYGLGGDLVAPRFMYLFHIILACIVFPAKDSLAVVALAAGLQLLCLALISVGILPPSHSWMLPDGAPLAARGTTSLLYEMGAMLAIWVVIWYLASELVRRLRQRDHQLAMANRKLEASLEERTLHMLQTTHQLKAPFAAIHAQTQLLLGGYCGEVPGKIRVVVERIATRAQALSRQIQSMLQLANLRSRGQAAPPKMECDLAATLENILGRLEPSARQRGIRFLKRIRPLNVRAPQDHVTMLLENIIVNAVNYSFDGGVVSILCLPQDKENVLVSVRDRGIGIPEDTLPRVFDDYFRTDEAAAHNRTSTGLGLAIVRQVASGSRISIRMKSAPGWGTRFIATLPGRVTAPTR